MASLPPATQIDVDILTRTEQADDIARLKTLADLPSFQYVDVSANQELLQALERWPLLAHIDQQQADNPPLATESAS